MNLESESTYVNHLMHAICIDGSKAAIKNETMKKINVQHAHTNKLDNQFKSTRLANCSSIIQI